MERTGERAVERKSASKPEKTKARSGKRITYEQFELMLSRRQRDDSLDALIACGEESPEQELRSMIGSLGLAGL